MPSWTALAAAVVLLTPAPPGDMLRVQLQAEDQTPSGRFTTATEVRPILGATRANWIAVREYDGQDLLYLTHLLSWRCGLAQVEVAINEGPSEVWPMPDCLTDTASPNAIPDAAQIYTAHPLGSIRQVRITLTYDDLATESADFERQSVLMP